MRNFIIVLSTILILCVISIAQGPLISTTPNCPGISSACQVSALGVNTAAGAAGTVTIAQGSLTADAQGLAGTATWNSSGVTFTGMKYIITDSASVAGSKFFEFFNGATSEASLTKTGILTINSGFNGGASVYNATGFSIGDLTRTAWTAPSDGVYTVSNHAGGALTGGIDLGGDTASFPRIARNGTGISIVLADGSGTTSGLTAGTIITTSVTGTVTNDNAPAGAYGEYVTSQVVSGSAVNLATTSSTTITSIVLTAGDWDVTGVVDYVAASTTSVTVLVQGSSSTANCVGAPNTGAQDSFTTFETAANIFGNANNPGFDVPVFRYSLAATTTICLVTKPTFTASTLKGYGTIRARRMR